MISSEDSLNNNNDNMVSGFDESTCSVDSDCDIFDNADDIITEDSTVWVNTHVDDFVVTYIVKLSGVKTDNYF